MPGTFSMERDGGESMILNLSIREDIGAIVKIAKVDQGGGSWMLLRNMEFKIIYIIFRAHQKIKMQGFLLN